MNDTSKRTNKRNCNYIRQIWLALNSVVSQWLVLVLRVRRCSVAFLSHGCGIRMKNITQYGGDGNANDKSTHTMHSLECACTCSAQLECQTISMDGMSSVHLVHSMQSLLSFYSWSNRSIGEAIHSLGDASVSVSMNSEHDCVGMKRRACMPTVTIVLVFCFSMCYVDVRSTYIALFTSWFLRSSVLRHDWEIELEAIAWSNPRTY